MDKYFSTNEIEDMLIESGIYFDIDDDYDSIDEDFNLLNDIIDVISTIIINHSGLGDKIQSIVDYIKQTFPSLPTEVLDKISDDLYGSVLGIAGSAWKGLEILTSEEKRKEFRKRIKKTYDLLSDLDKLEKAIKSSSYRKSRKIASDIKRIRNTIYRMLKSIEAQLERLKKK